MPRHTIGISLALRLAQADVGNPLAKLMVI